ncbi:UDP-glucose 4-epimerase GalE [Rhodohalobacter sp. SW132]|uniref:UDP-glucose 4-epimerase GalE n=1 Tax=Rhodohalobacter sp. SW132 TaxID=2293433 RepID=UPI000E22F018|nr:UDP-glucose 4-epimerase GalE [Rhodohalobacter sp. SW132]REL33656.1 UDP-glucose 4-epimerase GalE [Rhodohalobacter sp. SW132]
METILVTGGTGFIGSHTIVELLTEGYRVVAMDNLSNSKVTSLDRVEEITGKRAEFIKADLLDEPALDQLFSENNIDAVIHFAGLKAVGESVEKPLMYYTNNITGTVNLCRAMQKHNVKRLVFSSSATVYGDPSESPLTEDSSLSATNPYGQTKLTIEYILRDLCVSDPSWKIALLRYFNPVGAHQSGIIGEDPSGIPNNLMPFVTQVAVGKREKLSVFGGDYPTHDGTGVRDYIHVVDLAKGHLKSLEHLDNISGAEAYNLGTGKGSSVLDVIHTFEKATGQNIDYEITDRRPGDAAICFADPSKAEKQLNWQTELTLEEMCRDAWNWQTKNPNGYERE